MEHGVTADSLRASLPALDAQGDRLYAVADAARAGELVSAANRWECAAWSLFEGSLGPWLGHVAPHLISLDVHSGFLDTWAAHLGASAGILLISAQAPDALRTHLRRIFLVHDETGAEFFFRYYDPRVLRRFLPTCTGMEVHQFFGPVRYIVVEGDARGAIWICSAASSGAQIRKTAAATPARTAPAGGRAR